MATAAATRDGRPTVARASLQTLEDAAAEHQPQFDAAALARSWIAAGERLGNVAAMLAAARDEGVSLERTLGDADGSRESPLGKDEKVVVESVESESTESIITNAAANAARDALDAALAALAEDPLGDSDGAVAARRVVVDALGAEDAETKVGETKTEKGTSSSASALAALAAARRAAHATLRAFARGDAPRAARGVALELLGVVAGDDDLVSEPLRAYRPCGGARRRVGRLATRRRRRRGEKISGVGGDARSKRVSDDDDSSVASTLLAMRTAAAAAALGVSPDDVPDEAVADPDAATAFHASLVDAAAAHPEGIRANDVATLARCRCIRDRTAVWARVDGATRRARGGACVGALWRRRRRAAGKPRAPPRFAPSRAPSTIGTTMWMTWMTPRTIPTLLLTIRVRLA